MESFYKAQNWLLALSSEAQFFRKKKAPSLDAVERILEALDRPDTFFDVRIIVGGTAGKGTVCHLTEDVLLRSGKTVVTITSPHLQVVTERIRINGKIISAQDFGKNILKIKQISESLNIQPTYYEAIVLAGIMAGKNAGCEIFIGEIGLGGRLDAINAVRGKRIAALTFIGEDHLDRFGTLENMAHEKSGIFTNDSILNLSYEKQFQNILSASTQVRFLSGIPQKLNKKLSRKICEAILEHGNFQMQKIQLPARWEKIENIILDNAHSRPRFEYILSKIKKLPHPRTALLALSKNHDPQSFEMILNGFDRIIWTEVSGEREFWKPEILQKKFSKGEVISDISQVLTKSTKKLLITGSMYLCGEARNQFYPVKKILEQQTMFPV
jgi:folylpolyglutamate synthase/dihydropteroate synthase